MLLKNYKVRECKYLKIGDSILTKKGLKKITSIISGGRGKCYDISLFKDKEKLFVGEENFVLANGVISHNCNLSIIQDCLKYIEQNRGIKVKKNDIDTDNKEAIKLSSRADLVGIFQFENPATKPIADAVKMDSLNDIIAITSLIRPGPRDMGMDKEYAERKHREKSWKAPSCIKDVLSDTYGIIIFQEQIQLIAQKMAGFTPSESNKLRKLLNKEKNPEVIEKTRVKFIKGCKDKIDNGDLILEEVQEWWGLMVAFARYGFNASHATSYATISSIEFFLKHNFFKEYITALMNNTAEPARYVNYARKHSLTILNPSINKSKDTFQIVDGKILYSLSHIKQIGGTLVKALIERQPYETFEDWLNTVPKRQVNKRVFMNLLYAGAFDEFGDRYSLLEKYWKIRQVEEKKKADLKRKKPKPEGAKKTKKEVEDEETWEKILDEHTNKKIWERKEIEVLGTCLSKEPLYLEYKDKIKEKKWCSISELDKRNLTFAFGKIKSINRKISKNGNDMMVVTLTDDIDDIDFYVWSNSFMHFTKNVKVGYVGAFPLDKFKDSNVRFWASFKEPEILIK